MTLSHGSLWFGSAFLASEVAIGDLSNGADERFVAARTTSFRAVAEESLGHIVVGTRKPTGPIGFQICEDRPQGE
jgi:hypothetical protein